MSLELLERKAPVLELVLPEDPDMPVAVRLGEAEELWHTSTEDADALASVGITEETRTDLKEGTDLLRYTETVWTDSRFGREEARRQWSAAAPSAYIFRDELIHSFRYGYRKDPETLNKVESIVEGSGHDDMLLDLGKLAVVGQNNPEPLTKINFDLTKLDQAASDSDILSTLYAEATVGDLGSHPHKEMRDRAYTHLKELMDEIRDAGKYLFWKDDARKKLYRSDYLRNKNGSSRN